MESVAVHEMVLLWMKPENVYHLINVQVSIFNKMTTAIYATINIFLGFAPDCPANEVYNDCNRGYEPFCCNESFNQIEAGQMAQLPFYNLRS